jgi:hypothetical protein
MKYRRDNRTVSQFKSDLLAGHSKEAYIALGYAVYSFEITGEWPEILPNGSDMTGKLIYNNDKVTHAPDFIINANLIEIAHSNPVCKYNFHEKVSKINKCVELRAFYLFGNGVDTDNQTFFVITPDRMKQLVELSTAKYGIVSMPARGGGICNKNAYRFSLKWLTQGCEKPRPLPDFRLYDDYLPNKYDWLTDIVCQKD